MKDNNSLEKQFRDVVFLYEYAFCRRMKFDKGEWIHFGKLYFAADYYFSFNDMMQIVDLKIPAKKVIEWYNYVIYSGKSINILPYLKGARHRKERVYLSAQVTGKPIEIFHKQFLDAELKARKLGYDVINPIYESVKKLGFYADWIDYMKTDIELLSKADAIWFFSGGPDSKGVAIERAIAEHFGIKTIEL